MSDKNIQKLRAAIPESSSTDLSQGMDEFAGNGPIANLPVGPTDFEVANDRLKREDATSTSDYIGSVYRQDGLIDGTVASIVGRQLMPDPNFNVHEAKTWADLTEGVSPEFQAGLYDAHSMPHAMMIKDRILQKQTDLIRLGDMGAAGIAGRLALNVLMPDQILAGMAGGWVTRGVKAAEILNATRGATKGLNAAEAAARATAQQAARSASGSAIAAGIGAGAAGNAAFEKLRQNVNFEDSTTEVVMAGLLGAAITTPFAFAGAKAESRIARAAEAEHEVLRVLKKHADGEELGPAEFKKMEEVVERTRVIREVQAGRMDIEDARVALDESHADMLPESRKVMDQIDARLRVTREVEAGRMSLDEARKELDRIKGNDMSPAMRAALRGPEVRARADDLIDRLYANAPGKAATDVPDPVAAKTAKELKAVRKEAAAALKKASQAEATAEAVLTPKSPRRQLKDSHKASDKVVKSKDPLVEAMRKMVQDTDGTVKAPIDPVVAPEVPAKASVATEAPKAPEVVLEAPVAAPRKAVGDYAEWANKKNPEDFHSGTIESISPDGFARVVDEDGKTHVVHQDRILGNQPVPEGFHAGGSVGAAQVIAIKDVATQATAMQKARIDISATLNKSESELVRSLGYDLVKDPIQNDDVAAQGWTASEYKSHLRRTVAGAFHRVAKDSSNEAAKVRGVRMWERGAFNHEFFSLVSRYSRGDLTINQTHADILPMITKASKAQRQATDTLLAQAKLHGVKGAEDIQPNAQYVNRVWNQRNITEALRVHGDEAVIDLLARSINVPGHIGNKVKAASFLSTIRKLEFAPVMQNIQLYAADMGTLRRELANSGKLSPTEIDDMVDLMFTAKDTGGDTGRQSNLKYRFDIEETMSANTPTGVLRISDLFENDARVLVDIYTNSMAGHIGLAKKGIHSQAEFMERMRLIAEDAVGNPGWDQGKFTRDVNLLNDVYANITGKPMSTQDFSPSARIAATMRGYTRALMLGQLGLTAAFEMGQAVGYMGVKVALQQMPSFRQFFHAIRTGHIPDSRLARDIEVMAGFGMERDMSFARVHEIDDGGMGRALTLAERGANKASHAVDIMSGNASMTSLTRQWSAKMAIQEMHDFATGAKKLTDAHRARFVGHGLDHYEVDGVIADLKTYSTATNGHKLESVDYEQWLKDSPETYEKFQLALSRKVRDAVQDQDLGETMPFMHTTLGKVMAELKTFMLVSHAKNFLKNLHYRDGTSFQMLVVSLVSNAMAYMTQMSLNYAHDPDKLSEMLTMDRIGRAVFARTAMLGLMPMVAEFGYGAATGGESLFMPGSTGNTDNRTVIPPSGIILNRLAHLPSNLSGMALPNTVTTQKEGREVMGLIPNLFGVRNAAHMFTTSLPKSDPEHPGQ